MKLQGASTPRPMTHDLLFEMLGELDVDCSRVSVTELRENTFYASITLTVNGREVEIDSRPSDALALAVRAGAPIFAAEDVIAESAIEFEHEVEDTEEVVDKFKEFLDQVSLRTSRRRERLTPGYSRHRATLTLATAAGSSIRRRWRTRIAPGTLGRLPELASGLFSAAIRTSHTPRRASTVERATVRAAGLTSRAAARRRQRGCGSWPCIFSVTAAGGRFT